MSDAATDNVPRIGAADLAPNEEIIQECEHLLELARSGELRGITHVCMLTDKTIRYGVFGEMKESYLRTVGLLHWLSDFVIRKWDESTET